MIEHAVWGDQSLMIDHPLIEIPPTVNRDCSGQENLPVLSICSELAALGQDFIFSTNNPKSLSILLFPCRVDFRLGFPHRFRSVINRV